MKENIPDAFASNPATEAATQAAPAPSDEAIMAWAMEQQTDAVKALRASEFVRVARAVIARWAAAPGMDAMDAARYRWLRNQMLGVDFDWCGNGITALVFEVPDGCAYGGNCDQNIDTALAAQAKR